MVDSTDIVVIGAGVIGMTCALRLAQSGREVTVLDPNEPGSGASYGNAGTIANYAVLPINSPDTIRALPDLMFNRDSPLAVRLGALHSIAPWLLSFVRNCTPARAERTAAALADLLSDALPLWEELARDVGAHNHLRANGCLYRYDSRAGFEAARSDAAFRRRFGVDLELLTPADMADLEPTLPPSEGGGHLFRGAMSLDDPGAVMACLAAALGQAGVDIRPIAADRISPARDHVTITTANGPMRARYVVIATGAHSKRFTAQAGERILIDTERGYHVEYDMDDLPIRHVVSPAEKGFYIIPMAGRLRVSGTVEMGGLKLPPNPARHDLLDRGVRRLLPDLPEPDRKWMGFRPSVPDSIPVIRPSRGTPRVIYAFGHGHLGLTLAPRTAKVVCAHLQN